MIDSNYRLLAVAALGGGWNLLYALYHFVLAVRFRSYWFLTMGVYYLIACGMKASALHLNAAKQGQNAERRAIRRNGLLTLCLAVIFSGVVYLTIAERRNTVYHIIIAISMAAYTFYYVFTAIINVVRLKNQKSVRTILLRNTSMVYALGSLFGLERMMLGTFGNSADSFTFIMETVSGAGIFLVIATLGISLIRLSAK